MQHLIGRKSPKETAFAYPFCPTRSGWEIVLLPTGLSTRKCCGKAWNGKLAWKTRGISHLDDNNVDTEWEPVRFFSYKLSQSLFLVYFRGNFAAHR